MPDEPDKHPIRSLLISLAFGVAVFDFALFLILTLLSYDSSAKIDPSAYNFYWLLTFCGLLFGFERWLYVETGGVNPFHDH